MSSAHLDIAIQQLTIGAPLQCDILDAAGDLLIAQGTVLDQSVVDDWTSRGFTRVRIKIYTGLDDSRPAQANRPPQEKIPGTPSNILQLYDSRTVQQLAACFTDATNGVNTFVMQLAMQGDPNLKLIEPIIQTYLSQIDNDSAVVLSNIAAPHDVQLSSTNKWLGARSVRMSVLGATIATSLQLSREQCMTAAIAGLLHDISLFEDEFTPSAGITGSDESDIQESHQYWVNHSLRSAEMLSGIKGIPDVVRVVISQVHEQVDGQGYPRGLSGRHINVVSRILNLVDAYLTLTEPLEEHLALVPSDAVAYLISHTNQGAFDRECMKSMLLATSLYPVGSRIELDDSSEATVLRSSGTDPVRPIICVGAGQRSVMDLRGSQRKILKPMIDPRFPSRRRLPSAAMKQVLWKPSFITETAPVAQ